MNPLLALLYARLVNQALKPVARDDAVTIGEDEGAVSVEPLANDTAKPLFGLFPQNFRIVEFDQGDFLGTVTLSDDGMRLIIDAGDAYDDLDDGESLSFDISYTARNWQGGTDSAILTVTVEGKTDGTLPDPDPEIGGDAAGSVAEDGVLTDSGTLTISNGSFAAPASLAGLYGTFTFDVGTGAWSYTLNNDLATVQALNTGESLVDELVVESTDGKAQETVQVTIAGVDEASIGGDAAGSVAEDGTLTDSGTLTISNGAFAAPASLAGLYGTFTFDVGTGEWTYTLNNDLATVQALNTGESLVDELVVESADGKAQETVQVTIAGVDEASIGGDAAGAVAEDGVLTDSGTLTISNGTFAAPASLAGLYGTFTFDTSTGEWGYTLNNDLATVQALNTGESLVDELTVESADGKAQQTVQVTIAGVDEASIGGDAAGSVAEDGTLTDSGTLTISNGAFAAPASLAGLYGTFTFDTGTGAWTYTLNNDLATVQALGTGESLVDELTVESTDGKAQQIVQVTIAGVDEASIGGDAAGAVAEDGTLTDSGTLTISNGSFAAPVSLVGLYGTFTFDVGTGEWTYTLDNDLAAVQALGTGESLVDELVVESTDGKAQETVQVTIAGVDEASIGGDAAGAVAEDGTLTDSGTLTISNGTFAAPASLAGLYGTFTFDTGTGEWGYTLNNDLAAVQALNTGESLVDELTVESTDGAAQQTVQVTIAGMDELSIGGDTTGSVTEDGVLTDSGTLVLTGGSFAAPLSLAGLYGLFTFDTGTGAWTYTLNNLLAVVQELDDGEQLVDTLTVESLDGLVSVDVQIAVLGADDAGSGVGTPIGISFEDVTPGENGTSLPNGYADFDGWARAKVIDSSYVNGSGIAPAAASSGTNVIVNDIADGFDAISIVRNDLFDLKSGYFSAIDGEIDIVVTGFDDDRNPVVVETITISGQQQYVEFGAAFENLEVVSFDPEGFATDLFAIDDLQFDVY